MTFFRVTNKFKKILSAKQKRHIVLLIILMIIAGFMEMLSVSLMLPFVEAVMNPEKIMEYEVVQFFCNLFHIGSSKSFLVYLSLLMAVIYLFKNMFLLFQIAVQNKFVYQALFTTQQRLLKSFLWRPYESFLEIQSGEVLRIIGTDTVSAFGILTHILNLVTEIVVSITLLVTVLVISPIITIGIGSLLILIILAIQFVTRPILRRAGENHQRALSGMNKWMLQSIQGIKEIKLMQRESYFQENFENEGRTYVNSTYKQMTLSAVPKYLIEAFTMGIFFIVVAFMFIRGSQADFMVPILSSIAMAAIRLLPAASRISGSMAGIIFGEPAVDKLIENLENSSRFDFSDEEKKSEKDNDKFILNEDIRLDGVYYQYPTGNRMILSSADMEIKKGTSIGIIGASGAGKTTVVDLILGLLRPRQGAVLIDGKSIRENYTAWLSNIGYIPQTIFLLDSDIKENVAFGVPKEEINEERVWKALKEAALDKYVRDLPKGINTEIGERGIRLSGGQRQRLGIARALYFEPDVIVFDEATSALDNDTENAIMESINHLQGKKTMIIIAHRLSTIDECDVIYKINNGKIERQR